MSGESKGDVTYSNVYHLRQWCLKLVKGAMVVEGLIADSGCTWHSGPVTEVCLPDGFVTKSGSLYCLVGPPDVSLKEFMQLSDEDFKLFSHGLPPNWTSLVWQKRTDVIDNVFKKLGSSTISKNGRKDESRRLTALLQPEPAAQNIAEDNSSNTPDETTNGRSFVNSFKRSSRGRLLKPVLKNITKTFCAYTYSTTGELLGLSGSMNLRSDDATKLNRTERSINVPPPCTRKTKKDKVDDELTSDYEIIDETILSSESDDDHRNISLVGERGRTKRKRILGYSARQQPSKHPSLKPLKMRNEPSKSVVIEKKASSSNRLKFLESSDDENNLQLTSWTNTDSTAKVSSSVPTAASSKDDSHAEQHHTEVIGIENDNILLLTHENRPTHTEVDAGNGLALSNSNSTSERNPSLLTSSPCTRLNRPNEHPKHECRINLRDIRNGEPTMFNLFDDSSEESHEEGITDIEQQCWKILESLPH